MGKLLCLELYNFKSYKGHHVLQFGDSYFTSIIGPNGSGKSNSMDAISFVLGIKSSHLRSAHLKDLVYRGRVLKHSKINADGTATETTNGEVNGDGEVEEAPVASQRNDPRDAYVVAVYEDDAGDEQRWKRTITSSGQSEYRINNRQVTAKQYNEALEAENILIKARNFLVFQGDVEAIASQNAKDLTRLIEQISGSLDYKNEYERLKLEKERADEDQADKLNTRRGINGEIKAYREQKDELDRFEAKRKEKDAATVTHVLWKLFHFQRTIEDSTAEIQKHNAELAEYKRNVQKYETSLEDAKKDHAKVGREVTKIEREIKRKEKEVEDKENELVPIDEKLSTHRKNVQTYQKRIAEIAETRDSQQQSADKLQKDLTKVENAQKRWQEEWSAQQKQAGRELTEQDLQEYQRLSAEVYKQSGNDRAKIDTKNRQLKTDEETVNSLKSKLDATQAQVGDLESDIQALTERQNELNRTAKATAKEIHVKKNALNALSSERDINAQKQRDMEDKYQTLARKLTEAQDSQRESRKEANQRETVAQMKRIFPGVRGMVHQLCKPKQKRFENAIVTALGRHWDAVIVDSEKTAKECIQYLRDQRISRMAFIPLDTIIHTPPNANLRGLHQGTRLAIDAIDFENNLERAMGFVCGNTLVTDTVDIAKHLCYERNVEAKAVALDGTIIHRGGNMTGGAEPNDKRRQFAENELETMRVQEQKLRADLAALPKNHKRQAEEEALKSELIGFETKLSYTQDELKTLERNILSKTKELTFLQKQLKEVQRKHDEQSQGVENMRAELEEERENLAAIEDRIFAKFCQRLGYADIREYEKQQGSLQQEAEQRKQEFTKQISKLRNQISFEKERLQGTKKRITDVEAASKRDSDKIVGLEQAKEQINEDLEALNAEIDELNEKLSEQQQALEKREEKVTEARRELQKRSKNVENTLKEIATLDAEIQKASSGRYATLKSCQMENIELPLEEGSRKLATLPLEQAVLGGEEDDEDAMDVDGEPAEPRVNDYGIHVDFEELEEELQEDDSEKMDAELAEKISNLQSELEKMQPNMRSAERLNQTNVRLQGVEKEFDESRSAAKKATREFEKVKNKRMDLFNKAFKHISEQIQPVYAELTKTSSFPLGGQASLDVEDDNEPYLSGVKYHAMPPLKRFRDMEHLSGGEKTMAALALLFAIHTYAPSPFFVLDEVDAALDNANTSQLAQYVRDHAGPGMQFVVISLKTGLFQNSETLVGIMRDQAVNSSRALTLDLRKYQAV